MRTISLGLAFVITLMVIACQNSSSQREAELAKKEKELLEKEKELLQKENETLQAQQAQEQEVKREAEKNREKGYSPSSIVGNWEVAMNCTSSDCSNSAVGDIRTETWQIQFRDNKIKVTVTNSDTQVKEYEGTLNGNTLTLKSTRTAGFSTGKATINVSLQDDNQMTGTREVLKGSGSTICKIEYYTKVTRTTPAVRF